MIQAIIKRNGKRVPFEENKLKAGILAALQQAGVQEERAKEFSDKAFADIKEVLDQRGFDCVTAEDLQKVTVSALSKYSQEATSVFLSYAFSRKEARELRALKKALSGLTYSDAKDNDSKRENANIDGDTAMGTMLKYGSESAKSFNLSELISPDIAEAHKEGYIHIHDLDFYSLTETCCQINLRKLFKGGFSTGHGYLREPGNIGTASALACIAIQANQNDQHGGQSIPCFDYYLAPYVTKSLIKEIKSCFTDAFEDIYSDSSITTSISEQISADINKVMTCVDEYLNKGFSLMDEIHLADLVESILTSVKSKYLSASKVMRLLKRAIKYTERQTYQAMEALVHNLNTMNSRAGAQVPFSSINFGTDVSPEGRCVSKNLMQAVYDGLGNGETAIFPITIFKCKSGVNFEPGTPNYDLFQQAIKTTAKRLFPNFSFIDAPFNKQYYKPGKPETEIAYMGCRTRVIGNVYDSSREIVEGRGNLSFTTINLPRLGILCRKDVNKFFELLDEYLELVRRQLLERLEIQSKKTVKNYPFLMGQGVWIDSEKLYPTDSVADILKHGTLSIGFIGLAECLTAILGVHHGESEEAQQLGLRIIKHMREYTDKLSAETKLNWSVLATPAEGLAGRFVKLDRNQFGNIPGVTNKDWYTNSFHVPVEFKISFYRKLQIEGAYHELTNGGHISYVELDGDVSNNLQALESIVRRMAECGIGYGAINHPVDRDSVCGYLGVINDECPLCKRREFEPANATRLAEILQYPEGHRFTLKERGKNIKFDRIRRITGYLVGTVDRFNDAKREELLHRTKHL